MQKSKGEIRKEDEKELTEAPTYKTRTEETKKRTRKEEGKNS